MMNSSDEWCPVNEDTPPSSAAANMCHATLSHFYPRVRSRRIMITVKTDGLTRTVGL